MIDDIRSEQFDQELEAYLAGRSPAEGEFQTLLELSGQLRELPDPDFKTRLLAELGRRKPMTATTKLREGFHALTPYLMVRDGAGLVDFLKRAFGAVTTEHMDTPTGGMHAEVRIGDSMMMIGGGAALPEKSTSAIHMFVDDPDSVYQRAIEAGAKSLGPVEDRHYGERSGFVEDPFGTHWYIAKALPWATHFEGLRTLNAYLHPKSARGLIEFLKQAFEGQEIACFENEGRVAHAQVRIGDSVVEMGESEPKGAALYVYVDDPDKAYRNALAAGATSMWEPADQPYGERNAGVMDPFGNQWFPAKAL